MMTIDKQIEINDFIIEKAVRKFDPGITKNQLMQKPLIVGSWGAKDWGGINDDALVFQVNGRLHKGTVIITLNGMDTYDIHLFNGAGNQVGESVTDIYCDQLTDVIDELVETPN